MLFYSSMGIVFYAIPIIWLKVNLLKNKVTIKGYINKPKRYVEPLEILAVVVMGVFLSMGASLVFENILSYMGFGIV